MGPLWHRCCDELILVSQIDRGDFREEGKNTDDESGNHRHHLSRFYGIKSNFVWTLISLPAPFILIVSRPTCDSEWCLLCHFILAFCFSSLFLLCKNMPYFSLCTDYFV